jgi:hypothetical protein
MLINMKTVRLYNNKLSGAPLIAHLTWCGSTSLPLASNNVLIAPAGSIPTEFGKLINLGHLVLDNNNLSGTSLLLMLPGMGVPVYHLHNELPKMVAVVAAVVAAVQVVLQVTSQVMVQAKICADALSVSYPPGAQVKRRSRCSWRRNSPHAVFPCDGPTKDGMDRHGGRAGVGQHVGRTRQQDGKQTGQDRRQGGRVSVGRQGGRTLTTGGRRRVRQGGQAPRSGGL